MKSILGRANGGTHYSKLTSDQKKEVKENYYDRKMVKEEKEYSYFFNSSGKCTSAT